MNAVGVFMEVWRGNQGAIDALKQTLDALAVKLMVPAVRDCLAGMSTSAEDGLTEDDIFRRLFPVNEFRAEMAASGAGPILSRAITALVASGELVEHPVHGDGYYVWTPLSL